MTSTPTLDGIDTPLAARRPWRRRTVLAYCAAALGFGAALLVPSIVDGSTSPDRAPAVPAAPMSADAAERWLSDPEPATAHVGSADAAERQPDTAHVGSADAAERQPDTAHVGSADAAERRAITARDAQREGCTGTSADAIERCLARE